MGMDLESTNNLKNFTRSQMMEMQLAEEEFLKTYPGYASTFQLDVLRKKEYARLDDQGHLYLDYTGGGLYAESQLREHMDLLRQHVFGNPHSSNPTSQAMTNLDERARAFVLNYFNASSDEYAVIFTSNASGALKLVGESYPFTADGNYLLTFDNHNSVNGIREFARAKGATISYLPVLPPELRVEEPYLLEVLEQSKGGSNNLFAYPAQSNFSGVQHPLEWIEEAQARGWDVLVDCAAFVPTNRLDLSRWHPDFIPISFYKMFGYPTGAGCLLARKTALAKLHRPWFAGGTIWGATVQGDNHYMARGEAAFEDGTLNYLTLPAVEIGLKYLQVVGIDTIHERVITLTDWLLKQLLLLRHQNGQPLVQVYGPPNTEQRGATIALNFITPDGHIVDERFIDKITNDYKLSLRTGCFCNPGAGEATFRLSKAALQNLFKSGEWTSMDHYLAEVGMQSGGAIRISLGIVSNFSDAYRFLQFARTFLDSYPVERDLPPRMHC